MPDIFEDNELQDLTMEITLFLQNDGFEKTRSNDENMPM